jgi:hypothetical protein
MPKKPAWPKETYPVKPEMMFQLMARTMLSSTVSARVTL